MIILGRIIQNRAAAKKFGISKSTVHMVIHMDKPLTV